MASQGSFKLNDRIYRDINISQGLKRGNKQFYKSTLTPKIAKKYKHDKEEKLPPITFENGSMMMSFGKNMSSITKRNQHGNNSTMLDNTILKGMHYPHDFPPLLPGEVIIEDENYENKHLINKKNYLTPLDFIQLAKTDPEMREEFCYMIKRDDPYDWEIVDFSQMEKVLTANKKRGGSLSGEYMTISSRQITHYIDGDPTSISLDEWEREFRIYSELKRIKFFNHYKLWKNFTLWRKLRRRTNFKKKRQYLESNLFIIDDKLGQALLHIRNHCYMIQNEMNLLDMNFQTAKTINEFKQHENSNVVRQSALIDITVNENIRKLLETSCKESLTAFKEENRIKNREAEGEDDDNDNKPMLIGDDTGKEMPYTQEATIRTHYKRLKKFIRLVDYLVLDGKLSMMNNSLIKVHDYLDTNREILVRNVKNNGGMIPLIEIKADFLDEKIGFSPSIDIVSKTFEETIILGIHHICDEHKMLLNATEFTTYKKVGETPEDVDGDGIDLYKLITNHDSYLMYKSSILNQLKLIFEFLVGKSEDLQEVLEIVIK